MESAETGGCLEAQTHSFPFPVCTVYSSRVWELGLAGLAQSLRWCQWILQLADGASSRCINIRPFQPKNFFFPLSLKTLIFIIFLFFFNTGICRKWRLGPLCSNSSTDYVLIHLVFIRASCISRGCHVGMTINLICMIKSTQRRFLIGL